MTAASPEPASSPSQPLGRSERKRRDMLAAAERMFLAGGYLGTNMDELAAASGVSKQTVYKHFGSKEALFVELVTTMTDATSEAVHRSVPSVEQVDDVGAYLEEYADRQLDAVMTPRILQLRRLVIGEVARFPELAEALHERGPVRAIESLSTVLTRLDQRGLLTVDDARLAATQFNWLVMGEPLNRAMLLGDRAIPSAAERREHVRRSVGAFLPAYAVR
ncbi:TetR family transcriptional regulator [Agromyces sp. CFH 90414]|uniref:TetR family transcriptional regulator n=1 Tax=Agromyces agglutinans TaxID=2662258 RepID=A0A6I2FCR8_9MICO|nr:TetR/AcrR family transcriptional regulator [Agromyces agglutinans]MRG60276.1 TetR family transcriptional regulator [Agromyces agglutinans]